MNTQITLILIGSLCLAVALGIKIGRMTFKHMAVQAKQNFDFEIKFHTDAHPIGQHGTMWVDCPAKGWKAEPIQFVFVGVPAAPQMSLDLMKKIWYEAEMAGYVPLALRTYIEIFGTIKPPRATSAAIQAMAARGETISANNIARDIKKGEEKKEAQNLQAYEGSHRPVSA